MGSLEGKNVIITGGSLGIGFEVAKTCVKEGATVVIASRNEDDLNKALNELMSIKEGKHKCYSLDVSQYNQIKEFSNIWE